MTPISTAEAEEFTPLSGGPRSVSGQHGLVVAVEARAARIGAEMLERGGNAVDAAIATLLALAVTHPSAASLGGEGFALVRPADGPTAAVDFVARAPAALTRAGFERMIAAHARGAAAVGVPGVVAGLGELHARFATLPFSELVAPALALARNGFPLGAQQAKLIGKNFQALTTDNAARALFSQRGRPLVAGQRFVQSDLAWILERLAKAGPDDFYRGTIAERLARALAPEGPSLGDLADYRALWRAPLSIRYRAFTVETMPAPSAGGVALVGTLLALGSMPAGQTGSAGDGGPAHDAGSTGDVHALLEAQRRAQAQRRWAVLDPDALLPADWSRRQARWLDPAFWLAVPIDALRATPSAAIHALGATPGNEGENTTHLSVSDRDGMVVSLTTTLCASFGAKIVAAGTGIVLNNAVATFSLTGDNQPRAAGRTTSSMAPSLLLSAGRTVAVLGTPGGDTIPSSLAQIIRHLVDAKWPLDRAIEAPRWHHGFDPDLARYEPSVSSQRQLLGALEARGHRLQAFRSKIGDANCIVFDGQRAYGYADSREPGVTAAAGR
jgi:gamma-glutamyltranspeptidase/glutathione hydrolase